MEKIKIYQARDIFYGISGQIWWAKETISALNDLLKELSPDGKKIGLHRLFQLFRNDAFRLYVLKKDGKIVGMGTLYLKRTLTVNEAEIHDVVMLPLHQGLGLGRKLKEYLVKRAKEEGVDAIELTSNPRRKKEGGELSFWEKVGFKKVGTKLKKDGSITDIYRLELK